MRRRLGIYVVADGVGGLNAGEVASSLAALSIGNFFEATESQGWPDAYRALLDLTLSPPAQRLSAAIRKANADVYHIASTRGRHSKMNTTVVAAYHPRDSSVVHVASVGDSRCYLIRESGIEQVTSDHTLRNEARVQYPHISNERLALIPESVLSRALGRRDTVELEVHSLDMASGDAVLLCSDGLNRMVGDKQILEAVMVSDGPDEACDVLVGLANDAGGRDNITTVLLRFD
jgi:PPM family protein phosphatase